MSHTREDKERLFKEIEETTRRFDNSHMIINEIILLVKEEIMEIKDSSDILWFLRGIVARIEQGRFYEVKDIRYDLLQLLSKIKE